MPFALPPLLLLSAAVITGISLLLSSSAGKSVTYTAGALALSSSTSSSSSSSNKPKTMSSAQAPHQVAIRQALQKARQLEAPKVAVTSGGEWENLDFWNQHDQLLKAAWSEWWQDVGQPQLPDLLVSNNANASTKDDMMDPTLQQAVKTLRQNPTPENEEALQRLFRPIIPGQVYQIPSFFTPKGIRLLRQHLDAASYHYNSSTISTNKNVNAGIPTRRPNGMNRYGIILDEHVEGAVSYHAITDFLKQLAAEYIRPLGRSFFHALTSRKSSDEDDCETYAFTIRYQPNEDVELKEHSDASIYTLNINLNHHHPMEDDQLHNKKEQKVEDYKGSSLYFVDENTKETVPVSFTPGMAILHKGLVRHAALPIQAGERHNLVIWLFGKGGYVRFGEYPEEERMTVQERWGSGKKQKQKRWIDEKGE